MDDILPGEIEKWQWIEEKARVFFDASGFKEIRTPLLEPTELFVRSIGQASDIVHKEMFSLKDRGDRDMTLRPEMTASVTRSVIENGLLTQAKFLKLYYMGPMFRAERPQAGRKRQFHQMGVEIINKSNIGGFQVDFEVIFQLCSFLRYVGLTNFHLRLNDLGNVSDQQQLVFKLKRYFFQEKSKLCSDCHYRLDKNVLRIFDCKNKNCQPVIDKVPWDQMTPLSDKFKTLGDCIKSSSVMDRPIPFEIDRRLVRGLDYYNGIVFEITAEGLGAQNAVAGGGRYDRLYQDLGGNATPCTGFSIGMERLLIALEAQDPKAFEALKGRKVYFAPLEDNPGILEFCREEAIRLREAGIRIETGHGIFSLSQHLKKANQQGGRFVVIVGPDEWSQRSVLVKDLEKREQTEVPLERILSHLKKAMRLC